MLMIRQGFSSERDSAALPLIDEIWSRINSFDEGDCETVTSTRTTENAKIACYPNPAGGYFYVTGIDKNDQFTISVIDVRGTVIYETNHSLIINTSDISAGNYIIRVMADGALTIQWLIIE